VVRTRAALEANPGRPVRVVAGSVESRDNIVRFGEKQGCRVSWEEREPGVFLVRLEPQTGATPAEQQSGDALFISSECLGRGDDRLGRLLTTLLLRTLSERPAKPAFLLLANGGVKLAVAGSDDVPALAALLRAGVRILVCGTCLDYYGMKEQLAVGVVSNMYEIVDILMAARHLVRV
jgi:selenium metabolism protein YedF